MTGSVIDFQLYARALDRQYLHELETESPLFVDFVTMSQVHHGLSLPKVQGGFVIRGDADGVVQSEQVTRCPVDGSFDDRMWLRCDGNRVEFHGNIARWCRRDNVFGYGLRETIDRINNLCNLWSLPKFTAGERTRYADRGMVWSGARFSRIDITMNHAAFNYRDAQYLLNFLAGHHVGRQKGSITPDGSTILYGYGGGGDGTKYVSGKVYLKAFELRKHLKKKSGSHVTQEVIQFCEDLGVLREEFTLKSRFLTQKGICYLGQITHEDLLEIYQQRSQLRRFKQMTHTDTSHLSRAALGTLSIWEKGEPLSLTRRTFYRHRKELLSIGVDISVPKSNVAQLKQPVRVIERASLVAPDWYRERYG